MRQSKIYFVCVSSITVLYIFDGILNQNFLKNSLQIEPSNFLNVRRKFMIFQNFSESTSLPCKHFGSRVIWIVETKISWVSEKVLCAAESAARSMPDYCVS